MADDFALRTYPAAPSHFAYEGRVLYGRLLSFTDEEPRRRAQHLRPKRKGAFQEDQGPGPRHLEAELLFPTSKDGQDSAARDYGDVKAFLAANPTGFLVHPAGGSWYAFCDGPRGRMRFAESVDALTMVISFAETDPPDDAFSAGSRDVPDVFGAAQQVTAQKTAYEQSVADYFGAIALAQAEVGFAQQQIQAALSQVKLVTTPIDLVLSTIAAAGAVTSATLGALNALAVRGQLLSNDVDEFVSSAQDLFGGSEVQAGLIQAAQTLVGTVQTDGQAYEDALIATSPTPAGAADAVNGVELLVASCLVLFQALQQQRPPVKVDIVPRLIDVVNLAKIWYPGDDAQRRASELQSLNHISNPGAIPGGTKLQRYTS